MVDSLSVYLALLQRGVTLCDTLAKVYEPDIAEDWADRTLMQIANLRMGLADRLANPKLTDVHVGIVMTIIDRYIDGHWADYINLPKPDSAKRTWVLELHESLTALMNEVADFYNTLFVDI